MLLSGMVSFLTLHSASVLNAIFFLGPIDWKQISPLVVLLFSFFVFLLTASIVFPDNNDLKFKIALHPLAESTTSPVPFSG